MTVRALDENGDIVTHGVQFLSGRQDVAQTISTRLKLLYGEYFRDIEEGTPLFQVILTKGASLQAKNLYLRRRIEETPGVEELLQFIAEYDIRSRTYTITSVQVLTSEGLMELERLQGLTPLAGQEALGG